MIILDDIVQGTPEWEAEKLGKVSSSKIKKIITPKGKRSDQRVSYLYQLAGEKVWGFKEQEYQSQEMKRGIELEPDARVYFEKLCLSKGWGSVRQVGMIYKDKKKEVLCSPDGIVGKYGLEIKNRNQANHARHLCENECPYDAFVQVQASMWITGFSHWFYFSYYPRENVPSFLLLVKRDEAFINRLSQEVDAFCRELKDVIKKLKKL